MELRVLWTLANIFAFNAFQVYGNLPVPVLHFEENIIEDEDTKITCSLPRNDFQLDNVKLVINSNVTMTNCINRKGDHPNVTCTVEVTREMHEMEFTCEAEFRTQSMPKKMNILTEPEFTDCPDKLVWLEGQENSFHCKAKGYPQPNVTCVMNNTIYKDGEKFIAMRNMSGEYSCRATNFDRVTKTVTVSVEYKPNVLAISISPLLRAKGDNVQITCEADGLPSPTYSWNTPSVDIQYSADKRTVTINRLNESHLGNYKCIVRNNHGTGSMEKTLTLEGKPKILVFKMEPSTEVLKGENVTLTCEATGFPPPILIWSTPVPDVELSPNNRTISIWGVKDRHAGSYSCMSQNKYGTDTQTQQLSLAVKPQVVKIDVKPSTSVAEKSNVTLTCVAKGMPLPTYTWVTPNPNVTFSANKNVAFIWNAKKIHEGDYRCEVNNKYGSDKGTVKISVQVPVPPGSRGQRRDPATLTISVMMIFISLFFYYL